ncbi:MAG: hypothetical protein JAZ11_13890 [Candidatus Thiodiazotropha lotti]|nr:hypothetical protein [Candidatus Thiodiazotropha lotti]
MSIRSWAYNKFADKNKAVTDDYLIDQIQEIFNNTPDCSSGYETLFSRATIKQWLDDGMTPDHYHILYLALNGKREDIEHLNPRLILQTHSLSEH